jgi:hypothetical protein
MEEHLPDIESPSLQKGSIVSVLKKLDLAIDEAKDLRDRNQVYDTELQKALQIVKLFIMNKKRICYGGMAINAHLTVNKFYDFTRSIPDYDFFSPDAVKDNSELVYKLESAGFESVKSRIGVHEGTMKIFVNYVAVADISNLVSWKYNRLFKNSKVIDGIHYADEDFLRMGMYLELSRPRGEVERWDKVYKRVLLLNQEKPPTIKSGDKSVGLYSSTKIPKEIHYELLNYCMINSMIYCGADISTIYEHPDRDASKVLEDSVAPILAYSSNVDSHSHEIKSILRQKFPDSEISMKQWLPEDEMVPKTNGVYRNGKLYCLLLQQDYCYSYNTVKLSSTDILKIASLDTAIALYYSLDFLKDLNGLVDGSCGSFAKKLVKICTRTRDAGRSGQFPLFSKICSGYQPSKASLLRAKEKRIQSLKKKLKKRVFNHRKTKKVKTKTKATAKRKV